MVLSNVNVYIGGENPTISCRTVNFPTNPIVVKIGEQFDTDAVQILMRRDQAETMARAILSQLQGDEEANLVSDEPTGKYV